MIPASLPDNEKERIRKLEELDILDTLEEQAYDDLTHLAAQICDTPIALVSLVDRDRQWFKSHLGLEARETPRELAFCAHAILGDDTFVVEDSDKDSRFHDNPLATDAPHVKFYAGSPLIIEDNIRIGTLCVIDNKARTLSIEQKQALEALARQVVSQLKLRIKIKEMSRLDHAKDEFLAMVSHELRTPLTSIYGSLGLLSNDSGQLTEPMKTMVNIAYRNTGRLLTIANDILDLAKMEAGKLTINTQIMDLNDVIVQAIELNMSYCEQCHCKIQFSKTDPVTAVIINADKQRIFQVISNLISNAAKFTHNGDTINISLDKSNNQAHVSVTDHGPGLTEDQQLHIFQKFKQATSNGNQKLPGTGLGLNISKHIIELHHGSIGCTSIPDQQTSFYFSLPLASEK